MREQKPIYKDIWLVDKLLSETWQIMRIRPWTHKITLIILISEACSLELILRSEVQSSLIYLGWCFIGIIQAIRIMLNPPSNWLWIILAVNIFPWHLVSSVLGGLTLPLASSHYQLRDPYYSWVTSKGWWRTQGVAGNCSPFFESASVHA